MKFFIQQTAKTVSRNFWQSQDIFISFLQKLSFYFQEKLSKEQHLLCRNQLSIIFSQHIRRNRKSFSYNTSYLKEKYERISITVTRATCVICENKKDNFFLFFSFPSSLILLTAYLTKNAWGRIILFSGILFFHSTT